MTVFLGLSFEVWQTVAIIALPFLLRNWPRFKAFLTGGSPKLSFPTTVNQVSKTRLFLFTAAICPIILRASVLSPSRSNPFTIAQMPIAVSPASLGQALAAHYQREGYTELPYDQATLMQRLSTLDSRLQFITLGRASLLECNWCMGKDDHLWYTLPAIGIQYALVVLWTGFLTADKGRQWWRTYFVTACILGLGAEIAMLLTSGYQILPTGHGYMLWDKLHLYRHLFFGVLVTGAWMTPPQPEDVAKELAGQVMQNLAQTGADLEGALGRLRAAGLQRAAIMRTGEFRSQTNSFWETVERQTRLATQDPQFANLDTSTTTAEDRERERRGLEAWITASVPTLQ